MNKSFAKTVIFGTCLLLTILGILKNNAANAKTPIKKDTASTKTHHKKQPDFTIRAYHLQHASASYIAFELDRMFKNKNKKTIHSKKVKISSSSLFQGKVAIRPVHRTNSLVILSKLQEYKEITKVVKQLDRKASNEKKDQKVWLYSPKHVKGTLLQVLLSKIIRSLASYGKKSRIRTIKSRHGYNYTYYDKKSFRTNVITGPVHLVSNDAWGHLAIVSSTKDQQKLLQIIQKIDIPVSKKENSK